MVRYAKLALPFNANATQIEMLAVAAKWQSHLNTAHYTGSWTVLALRSPGGNHENIIADLMGNAGYQDTIYMDHFPSVKKLLAGLNCPVMAARFLNLQAGAIIKQHKDAGLAFENGEARLHFPVITNPDVEFFSENERIFLQEGECWYLNANLPHRVSNLSLHDRIHLVVDCEVNDWLKTIINSAEVIAYKKDEADPNILKAIEHLRYQNTEASNKLADDLEQQLLNTAGNND
jgi:hypothetical protein